MSESESTQKRRGPFFGLLATQLFFIGSTPFVSESGAGRAFLYAGIFGIMAAGAYFSASSRNLLTISIVFLVVALGAWLGPDVLPGRSDEVLRLAVLGLGYAFTAGMVVNAIARHERVTTDTILGGINGYLLIACSFTMFYACLMIYDMPDFTVVGVPLAEHLARQEDPRGFATFLYFSFTTLTTLGYGDIVPVSPISRMMTSLEAIIGQLYVAIFIARLVSLEVSQRQRTS